MFGAMFLALTVHAQSTELLWQAKLEPTFSYNLKSGLKGTGYAVLVNREIKNGISAEFGLSKLRFKSPGTLNPNGSKKFPSSTNQINFKTSTFELGIYKQFKPESKFKPVVGLGVFNRRWEETILENGTSTSQSENGASAGAFAAAGGSTDISDKLAVNIRASLHTNVHFYSIFNFRIGVGYRFGLI